MSATISDDDRDQANAFVDQASAMGVMPTFVFNSAITSVTPTEVLSVLMLGQRPLAMLIISPVMAKTLASSLLNRVAEYEELTGNSISTISEIRSGGTRDREGSKTK